MELTTNTTDKTVTLKNGWEMTPRVGSYIRLGDTIGEARMGDALLPGDEPCGSWAGCEFRWPSPVFGWREKHAIACNVTITGRALTRWGGDLWVRVKVEWVGDGEPSTETRGWLLVPWGGN